MRPLRVAATLVGVIAFLCLALLIYQLYADLSTLALGLEYRGGGLLVTLNYSGREPLTDLRLHIALISPDGSHVEGEASLKRVDAGVYRIPVKLETLPAEVEEVLLTIEFNYAGLVKISMTQRLRP